MRKLVIVNGPNNNFYGIRNKGQSNIHGRDDFRHISVTASECLGQIAGMGKHSYKIAMEAFKQMIEEGQL